MRAYSAAGAPLTGVTRVASSTDGDDFGPSVAASNGSFVVAYDRTSATAARSSPRYMYASGVPVAQGALVVDPTGQGTACRTWR